MTVIPGVRLLRSELVKMRSLPGVYALLGCAIALTALNTSLSLADPEAQVHTTAGVRHIFTAGRDLLVLFAIVGTIGATTEFRHGTMVPTLLAVPDRGRVLAAKILAYVLLGAAGAMVAVFVQIGIALPWLAEHGHSVAPTDAEVLSPLVGNIVAAAAVCGIGVSIGMLLRNQVAALMSTFGWFAVAENALGLLVPDVSRLLPGGAFSGLDQADADPLPLAAATVVIGVYVVALALITSITTLRRDVA